MWASAMGYSQRVAGFAQSEGVERKRESVRDREQVKREKQDRSHTIFCNLISEVTSQHFCRWKIWPLLPHSGEGMNTRRQGDLRAIIETAYHIPILSLLPQPLSLCMEPPFSWPIQNLENNPFCSSPPLPSILFDLLAHINSIFIPSL